MKYILTEVLISLGKNSDSPEEIERLLYPLTDVLEGLENRNLPVNRESEKVFSALPNSFIETVRKSAKQF